jgi:beta-aspartyl-peptidase (threonine type)
LSSGRKPSSSGPKPGRDGKQASTCGGPVLVVHGGAGLVVTERERRAHAAVVRRALVRGLEALASSAADAVVAAVSVMESAPVLNAGLGATLDVEGRVSLDAGFMEGAERRFGAVGALTRTINPIVIARELSREGDFGRFVVGPYADALVERFGARACNPEDLITPHALATWTRRSASPRTAGDTVGAVALDARGRVAAAVSTGGLSRKPPGRVGDSAVVGAGFWAEQPLGACVTTGIGEVMLREGTARRCARLLVDRSPAEAAEQALAEVASAGARPPCGAIVVACDGRIALAHTSPQMIAGHARFGVQPAVRARW